MVATRMFEADRFDPQVTDARIKGLVLICVIAVHGAVFVAVFKLHVPLRENGAQIVSTIFFVEERKRRPAVTPEPRQPATAHDRPQSIPIDRSDTDISSAPVATDWNAEREKIAGDVVGREAERANARTLLSRPNVIELAPRGTRHAPGDSQHFDDGEIITWLSEDCYSTNRPHDGPQLDPNRLHVVCKNRKKPPRTNYFDHMKPDYLRDPSAPPAKFEGMFSEDAKCEYSSVRCN